MISIIGLQIYDFSVAISDLALFVECIIIVGLLYRKNRKMDLAFFLFLFLGVSSLLGAIFHAFFPLKAESPGGFVVWMLTTTVIGLVAMTILYAIAYLVKNKILSRSIHIIAPIFFVTYLYMIFFVDYHYPTVIKFYAPTILLLGVVALWKLVTQKKTIWLYLLSGIVLSIIAALVQSLHINLDPKYLNYNTLYHIIQGMALIFFYIFFSKYQTMRK